MRLHYPHNARNIIIILHAIILSLAFLLTYILGKLIVTNLRSQVVATSYNDVHDEGHLQIPDDENYLINKENLDKSEFVSILNAIKEGILVLSHSNAIMYYNNSFIHQFSISEKILGKKYDEIIDIPSFSEFVQSLHNAKTPHYSKEISYNNRIILLSASISKNGKIFVIMFHDVSEVRALEKIKKDFVINASHELRTPLTSIKGFLELAEKEPQNNLKYIEIISRNTNRIINIINDLLKLSKLESIHSALTKESIDINEIILNNLVLFEQQIKDKGLILELDLTSKPLFVPIDKLKVEEVIINLIDNATKYTETGTIHIISKKTNNEVMIIIKDTGIGIPEKYHTRIFERFFVVDKARSRKTGGTGLGLAIIKHIIQLHKGQIVVKSKLGQGTEFIITLPMEGA